VWRDIDARVRALEIIFRTFARDRLFDSDLPTIVVLGDLEMFLGACELPTGGLTSVIQTSAISITSSIPVRENAVAAPTSSPSNNVHLREREWMIGEWIDAGDESTIETAQYLYPTPSEMGLDHRQRMAPGLGHIPLSR
jgi:hypothetical protein